MFLKLDTNSDGFLTFDELEAGMQDIASVFQQEEPDVRAMLNAADSNGDGQIDYTEFLAAAFQKDILLSTQNLRTAFSIFDKDGDGSISKEDLKQVFGDRRALTRGESVWDEIMAEVDKNQDGKI
jgi:calcium-dependent protein kinase